MLKVINYKGQNALSCNQEITFPGGLLITLNLSRVDASVISSRHNKNPNLNYLSTIARIFLKEDEEGLVIGIPADRWFPEYRSPPFTKSLYVKQQGCT